MEVSMVFYRCSLVLYWLFRVREKREREEIRKCGNREREKERE